MKIIFVLMACLAAANATSYVYPDWCRANFCILPATTYYNYCVYFPTTWCSSSYYSPILKVYPGDDCGGHCWSERSVGDITNELKNLLSAQLSKMCSYMYTKRDEFMKKIDAIHAEYKAEMRKYIYQYYTYKYGYYHCNGVYALPSYIVVRNNKVDEYCARLDGIRRNVYDSFNRAISAKITVLRAYHDRLIKAATDCLNTRLAKIAEFKVNIQKKIDAYYNKFYSFHCAIALKNRDHYKQILSNLYREHTHWWLGYKADRSVAQYYSEQKSKVYSLAQDYRNKLNGYKTKLINFYTCAYKCYMSNSCLRFSKTYYSQCKSLGNWFCYTSKYCYDHYAVAPFKLEFKTCTYKNLKTCDVDAAAGDISGVVADLRKKLKDVLAEQDRKFYSWKSTWYNYHINYKLAFEKIVRCRHTWYCGYMRSYYIRCDGVLTYVRLADLSRLKRDLEEQMKRVCDSYWNKLSTSYSNACSQHRAYRAKFTQMVEDFIAKIEKAFNDCKAKRTTAIAEYTKKLKESRDVMRRALDQKIRKANIAHWALYIKMLQHYHGICWYNFTYVNRMKQCYEDQLIAMCKRIFAEFDAYWSKMIPRLVQHFACCYSCNFKTSCLPTYRCESFYSWTYKLPQPSVYCYQYQLWLSCH